MYSPTSPNRIQVGAIFEDRDRRRIGRRVRVIEVNWTMRKVIVETLGINKRATEVKIDRLMLGKQYRLVPPPAEPPTPAEQDEAEIRRSRMGIPS